MGKSTLVIFGGKIWTPSGFIEQGSIIIRDEKIVDIHIGAGKPLVEGNVEWIDATGKLILPGLIDTHVHHRDPGFTHKEDVETATRAAAAGGVTFTVGMPNVKPPVNSPEEYEKVIKHYGNHAIVDFNLNPAATDLDAIPALAQMGCLAFKIFMIVDKKRAYPHMPGLGVHDHGELLEIFEAVAPTGIPLMVHPHNQAIMSVLEKKYWERGEKDYRAYARAQREYDGIVWDTAVFILNRLQEATGARLHICHQVSPRTVQLVREAKAAGRAVTSEVNGFGLFLGSWEQIEKKGPYGLGRWIPEDSRKALWEGINDGTIDVIGTDHAPHTKEEKEIGWKDMWKAPSGAPQLQDYFSQLLTRVHQGLLTLDQAVRITSHNPARVFGLYPRKGTIEVGSDADIVVVDFEQKKVIRNENALSKCGWTPYDGDTVKGVPIYTIVRGRVVMRESIVMGKPGYGQFIKPVECPG